MAISLQKGQKVNIGLSQISVGLGWNPNEGTGGAFDLDASAFMLNESRKLVSDGHFIFYNNTDSPDQAVHYSGDDTTGGNSTGDDETILIDLQKVGPEVQEILFVVTIHEANARKQNFGQVRASYIRIVDQSTSAEIAKYELDEDFSIETGIEFGRLYRRDGQWKFEASGVGQREELGFFLAKYQTA
jgi:tellurium resistance protein TerD